MRTTDFRARENPRGQGPEGIASDYRLSPAHFAYLRAWSEGLPRGDAARRYLGLEHGHQLSLMHDQVVTQLRALARRAGISSWRLIGMDVGSASLGTPAGASHRPSLAQWVAEHGYEDWSEAEQLALYAEAIPQPTGAELSAQRKLHRAARLRKRQLAVLAELEKSAAVAPRSTDPIDAWLDPVTSDRLRRAGFLMLGEVQQAARAGGRWWKGMPAVGVTKATRIAAYIDRLLPQSSAAVDAGPGAGATHSLAAAPAAPGTAGRGLSLLSRELDGSTGTNRAPRPPTIEASTDLDAIRAWVQARAGSPRTAAVYQREAVRWALWCALERGKAMSSAGPDDCTAYMLFLQRIPPHWIHRGQRAAMTAGWTPFRGALGLAGRRLAVTVLHLMCGWLALHARYLDTNPWAAVNRALVALPGDETPRASRALTPEAYAMLVKHATQEASSSATPASARNKFILIWLRHTGLRTSELLSARLGAMSQTRVGWIIRVIGKGAKPRDVTVPTPAVRALREYLAQRGLAGLEECAPDVPLVAATAGAGPVRYAAVHQSFTAFVRRAIRASTLTGEARERAARATQHWLRHTYATRFAEAGGAQDVLMAELGHADPGTTARYYTAQADRRQVEVERIAQQSP